MGEPKEVLEIMLTTKQIAILKGVTERTIRNMISGEKIRAIPTIGTCGGGKNGISYQIPFSALDDKEQRKYWKQHRPVSELPPAPHDARTPKPLDEYTLEERKVIQRWIDAIKTWQVYRSRYKGKMTIIDQAWVDANQYKYEDLGLSVDKLYRKWKALKENDYDGLIEKRGKWAKGIDTIPEIAWSVFEDIYLDENQLNVQKCYDMTLTYLERYIPELLPGLPTYHTFYRAIKNKIPLAAIKYFREGDKAFEDDAAPYISRMYENLAINEVWVADSHTLDVITIEDGVEKIHRMTVISFMDVKSRMITGWHITYHPSSEGVLYALRKGILRYGVPQYIYVDNGNEFLCFDIGGRGHRKSRKTDDHIPPGVFDRLKIEMWNAQVKNAKTKTIERTHKEYKENFSRLIKGFCGGHVLEKPENLKKVLKTKKGMLLDSELIKNFELYIEGIYNEKKSNGMGMYGRSPVDVYTEELKKKRTATADDLNLMLMRSTRMQTVGRKGVALEIYGEKLYYWTTDFLMGYQGKKVYLRYDPEDLRKVRVYNEDDAYLCTVQADSETILKYGASKEDVKKALQKIRQFKRTVKAYNEDSILEAYPKIDVVDLMLWKAAQNIEARKGKKGPEATVLEVIRANEPIEPDQEQEPDTEVEIDLDRMARNAM